MLQLAIILFSFFAVFAVAGVLLPTAGIHVELFSNPLLIVLGAAIAILTMICCFRTRPTLRKTGFYAAHFGAVLLLSGGFLGHVLGKRTEFIVSCAPGNSFNELPMRDGTRIKLDFNCRVTGFRIEFYDPAYDLFQDQRILAGNYVPEKTFDTSGRDKIELGELGTLNISALKDAQSGAWRTHHVLGNGWILLKREQTPKSYCATVEVSSDGKNASYDLRVNHPLRIKGWRLFLSDYDHESMQYIVVGASKDPGHAVAMSGIWLLMAGTFLLCFRRGRTGDSTGEVK